MAYSFLSECPSSTFARATNCFAGIIGWITVKVKNLRTHQSNNMLLRSNLPSVSLLTGPFPARLSFAETAI